jgi:hypothetical protein
MKERDLRKLLHQPIHVGIPKGEFIGNGKLTMAIARTSGRAALSWVRRLSGHSEWPKETASWFGQG